MANQFMPEKEVLKLKQEYPPGTRIMLNHMDDKWAVPPGTRGTVEYIDDGGHIHMRWDNGRSLSLVPEADDYRNGKRHFPMPLNLRAIELVQRVFSGAFVTIE